MATPAHRKTSEDGPEARSPWRRPRRLAVIAGAVVAAGALGTGVVLAVSGSAAPAGHPTATAGGPGGRQGRGPGQGQGQGQDTGSTGPATTTTTTPLVPLTVRSISPAPAAKGVATDSLISVTFSVPPRPGSPVPELTPDIAGHWQRSGSTWTFHPLGGYIPSTAVAVTVPASTTASEGSRSVHLASVYHASFTVGAGSVLRLQQMLAELKYLPLTFHRADATGTGSGAVTTAAVLGGLSAEPQRAAAVATSPLEGRFTWAYPDIPASLRALWQKGKANEITTGAIMAFEADHGLAVDGVAGPQVWSALVKAVAARQVDSRPYDYIQVTENLPESLSVWQAGKIVYTTPVNTGAPGAATALGTYPVYLRYASHEMDGTDADGTVYRDPGIPWIAYFNGGDAIHGYVRAAYGFPQSNGCVELPVANAGVVWNSNEDYYGTLVTIS
jgi:peptidoglycan hydrolase-like protein with peptidoglycan-binding domain